MLLIVRVFYDLRLLFIFLFFYQDIHDHLRRFGIHQVE